MVVDFGQRYPFLEQLRPDFQSNRPRFKRILNNINVMCEDKLNRERGLLSGYRRGLEKVACLSSQTYQ